MFISNDIELIRKRSIN